MPTIVNNIATALGNFIDTNFSKINEKILQPYGTLEHLSTRKTEAQAGNEIAVLNDEFSEVVQPFSSTFTDKGGLTIGARKVTMRRHKVNVGIQPDELVGQFGAQLGWYDERKQRLAMPVVQYIMRKMFERIEHDRETQIVYKGVYVPPPVGTPTARPANEGVNGFGKLIADAATATWIAPMALGTFTTATLFDYVETMYNGIPEEIRFDKRLEMYAAPAVVQNYYYSKRNKYDNFFLNDTERKKIDGATVPMIPLHSMAGRNRIIFSLKGNLLRYINENEGATNVYAKPDHYKVELSADWHECFAMANWDYVFVNDQA